MPKMPIQIHLVFAGGNCLLDSLPVKVGILFPFPRRGFILSPTRPSCSRISLSDSRQLGFTESLARLSPSPGRQMLSALCRCPPKVERRLKSTVSLSHNARLNRPELHRNCIVFHLCTCRRRFAPRYTPLKIERRTPGLRVFVMPRLSIRAVSRAVFKSRR